MTCGHRLLTDTPASCGTAGSQEAGLTEHGPAAPTPAQPVSLPPPSLCISVKFAPSSDNLVWRPTTTPCQAARARAALSPTDVSQTGLTQPSLKSHAGQHIP